MSNIWKGNVILTLLSQAMTQISSIWHLPFLDMVLWHSWDNDTLTINGHRELTVSSPWAHGDHGGHGAGAQWSQLSHGEVTAQSRLGHSSVTARSQLNHGIFSMITAQSRLGHSSITAQVTAQSRLAVNILVTVSSRWNHRELTVSSQGGRFFSHGRPCTDHIISVNASNTIVIITVTQYQLSWCTTSNILYIFFYFLFYLDIQSLYIYIHICTTYSHILYTSLLANITFFPYDFKWSLSYLIWSWLCLIHCSLVTLNGVGEMSHHWFKSQACFLPSHCRKQCLFW